LIGEALINGAMKDTVAVIGQVSASFGQQTTRVSGGRTVT
jgi:hypothetical protein